MTILNSEVLISHVNRYTILGLGISITSIILATMIVAYQADGTITMEGLLHAQTTNPAIWALDLTPFMFAYWGQSFFHGLVDKAETIIEDTKRELINEKDDLESKLKYESTHDSLTGLPNYKLFIERIQQALAQIKDQGRAAVIVLSINDLKEINYGFGSVHVNSFLKKFAEKLKALLLEPYMLEAYMGMNVIARLRNDEFAILLPRLSENYDLEKLLKNISQYTSVSFMIENINMNITTTIGAAFFPIHGTTSGTLMVHATDSIYFAKKEGKPYAVYQSEIQEKTTISRKLLNDFEEAIQNEKAIIHFTPHVELTSGKMLGVGAIVKLDEVELEMLNEEKLFQLMDDPQYAKKLTFFTLRKVLEQISIWHKEGHQIYGEIDLSVVDFSDLELITTIREQLEFYQIAPQFLKISLTEKACLNDQASMLTYLNHLANLGVQLSIKDFSTGYTSFVYLTDFPINEIKIDRSFVMKMMRQTKQFKIVQTIIQVAAALKLNVMAVGIPDEETVNQLIELGCVSGQGPYFGSMESAEDITERFKKNKKPVKSSNKKTKPPESFKQGGNPDGLHTA